MWWKNSESEQILNRGYLLKGETVEGAIDRICTAAAKRLYKPELKDSFVRFPISMITTRSSTGQPKQRKKKENRRRCCVQDGKEQVTKRERDRQKETDSATKDVLGTFISFIFPALTDISL